MRSHERLPNEWRRAQVSDLIERIGSGTSVNSEARPKRSAEFGVLKTSCVYTGAFRPSENKAVAKDEVDRVKEPVVSGAIIVSRMNTPDLVGASGYVERGDPTLFLPDRLWQLHTIRDIDARWLAAVIGSPRYRSMLRTMATGTSSSMRNISQDGFGSLPVLVPPLHEQQRIAEILRTWDEAIEKIERLTATKNRLLKNRREELAWCRRGNLAVQLSELLVQSSKRVGIGRSIRVFSVTKDGLVPQDEHFNKRIANEDVSRHMLVEQGEFAFSGLNFWLGSVDVSLEPEPFCISPDYKVFKIRHDVVPGFFRHLVRTDHFRHILQGCAVERASVVRKNFDRETFLASEIPLPDRGRQEAVLNVLSTAEHELFLLRRQLDALVRQKRGLMQKLLTGEQPVKVPESQEAAE